eukprot:gb/GECG01011604.1/.p1 GENE.gb/GECG01011604.1/~~gb/GECG01011604.1/.p1  ORF type:complete len:684 (+),score=83.90 gb/GECG01011604.1/:1-2052(+)
MASARRFSITDISGLQVSYDTEKRGTHEQQQKRALHSSHSERLPSATGDSSGQRRNSATDLAVEESFLTTPKNFTSQYDDVDGVDGFVRHSTGLDVDVATPKTLLPRHDFPRARACALLRRAMRRYYLRKQRRKLATVLQILRKSTIFRPLPIQTQLQLIAEARVRRYAHNTLIQYVGSKGEGMAVVRSGMVSVRDQENLIIATLHAGEIFGEQFVVRSDSCPVNIVSEGPVELLMLPRAIFLETVCDGDTNTAVKSLMTKIKSLKDTPGFGELQYPVQVSIAKHTVLGKFPTGADIIRCLAPPAYIVVAMTGFIEVLRPRKANESTESSLKIRSKTTDGGSTRFDSVALLHPPCVVGSNFVNDDSLSPVTLRAKGSVRCVLITADTFFKYLPASVREQWVRLNESQCNGWMTRHNHPQYSKNQKGLTREESPLFSPLRKPPRSRHSSSDVVAGVGKFGSSSFGNAQSLIFSPSHASEVRKSARKDRKHRQEAMDDKVSHAFGRRRGSTHQQREALKDLATSQHVGEVRKRATAGVEEKLKNEKASPLSWDRSHHRRASLTRESSAVVDKKIRKTSHPKMQVPVEETTRKEVGFEAQYGKDPTLSIMSKKRLRALLEETAAAGLRIPPTVYETLDTSKVRGDQATLKEIEENAEALRQIISDNSFSQAQATLDHENSSRQEKN